MSTPPEPSSNGDKPKLSPTRVVIWIVVAGIAIYLIASGIVGIIAKG
ncbi:hypothetical protein ACFPJ4_11765 [Lysinimonas soli]|uniref:Uncharacterized protein n=1 Tax=Lysinimonas soli TaxID=1074233 RepID=A0ABW0NS47_9MICO